MSHGSGMVPGFGGAGYRDRRANPCPQAAWPVGGAHTLRMVVRGAGAVLRLAPAFIRAASLGRSTVHRIKRAPWKAGM